MPRNRLEYCRIPMVYESFRFEFSYVRLVGLLEGAYQIVDIVLDSEYLTKSEVMISINFGHVVTTPWAGNWYCSLGMEFTQPPK